MSVLFRRSEKKEKKRETGCKLRCVRTLQVLIKSAEGSRYLISFLDLEAHAVHVPVPTYLDICSSKSVHFRRSRKENQGNKEKDVPCTEPAREGQFLAKVAEGKTKKSFLYNKNYYLIDEELSSTH